MIGRFWMMPMLIGCESGLAAVADIEVDDAVARAFDRTAPGVLVTDTGGALATVAALCGETFERITFVKDFGFGCLDDAKKGTTETLSAWVQPMPEGWNAEGLCALAPVHYSGIVVPPEVSGEVPVTTTGTPVSVPPPGLALAPEAGWAQGSTVAEWHKVPICGGTLRGDPLVVKHP